MFFRKINPFIGAAFSRSGASKPQFTLLFALALMAAFALAGCDIGGTDYEPVETLVCLGDSLTAGYGATVPREEDKSKSYPAYLEGKVAIPVINAGISGDTTAGALARLEGDVLSKNPRIVIINLGANDLDDGVLEEGKPPLEIFPGILANLKKIIERLNDGNRKIYVAKFYNEAIAREVLEKRGGISDYDSQTTLIKGIDTIFNTLSSSDPDNIKIIDGIWDGVWGIDENMSDEYHPNAKGYEIMAENYFKALKPYLEENNLLRGT
jgi:acyl-CoA thioesterase-1